jgi:hypothetical protein
MSTIETDLVQAATGTNTALKLKGKGSGVVKIGDGELSFPDADGSANQHLKTDGSGSLSFTTLSTNVPTSADGQALGSTSAEWSDLYLAESGVIYFGADQDVTVTHDPDDGLFFKSTATADNNPFVLTLQTGEIDIAVDDVLGKIDFQAPDEGTGTDAILVAAGISAISEGDFSSSSNATKLSFKTASSAAAAETMFLGSTGNLQVSSEVSAESFNLPITLNGTDGSSTDAGDNIVLDASAASTNVGERLLYEGIPETAITALGGAVVGADNTVSAINLKDYGEITNAIGSVGGGAQTIDLTLGNNVVATIDTSTTTFAFSNPTASDELCGFTLFLTNGGSQTVNWPGSVDWAGATAPTLTSSGLDIIVFITTDGGTIWHGMVSSADSS